MSRLVPSLGGVVLHKQIETLNHIVVCTCLIYSTSKRISTVGRYSSRRRQIYLERVKDEKAVVMTHKREADDASGWEKVFVKDVQRVSTVTRGR